MRLITRGLVFLLGIATACGTSTSSPSTSTASSQPDEHHKTELEKPGPLFWLVTSASGATSHLLATCTHVSSEQLIPEIWQSLDDSREVLVEQDMPQFFVWLLARNADLEEDIGPEDFQQVLIQVPFFKEEAVRKLPASYVIEMLVSPDQSKGLPIFLTVLKKAKESDKELRFLVEDHASYYEAFSDLDGDVQRLQHALHNDPSERLRGLRKARRACLRGDETGLGRPVGYTDERLELLEQENEAWLDTLGESFEKGDAFAAVSVSDLLSPNGLIARLRKRGFQIERALPGLEASRGLSTVVSLRLDECKEALRHIVSLTDLQASAALEDSSTMSTTLASPKGREFLALCKQQTTRWHDCLTDSETSDEAVKCDSRYPIE